MGPIVDVFLGVTEDFALSCRSGGGMDADDLFEGNGSQWKGISVPEVACCRKGEPDDVFEGFDPVRPDPRIIEPLPVEFGILVDVIYCPLESFQLKAFQLPLRPNLWHECFSHDEPPSLKQNPNHQISNKFFGYYLVSVYKMSLRHSPPSKL